MARRLEATILLAWFHPPSLLPKRTSRIPATCSQSSVIRCSAGQVPPRPSAACKQQLQSSNADSQASALHRSRAVDASLAPGMVMSASNRPRPGVTGGLLASQLFVVPTARRNVLPSYQREHQRSSWQQTGPHLFDAAPSRWAATPPAPRRS